MSLLKPADIAEAPHSTIKLVKHVYMYSKGIMEQDPAEQGVSLLHLIMFTGQNLVACVLFQPMHDYSVI